MQGLWGFFFDKCTVESLLSVYKLFIFLTTLHGWQHLAIEPISWMRMMRLFPLAPSLAHLPLHYTALLDNSEYGLDWKPKTNLRLDL